MNEKGERLFEEVFYLSPIFLGWSQHDRIGQCCGEQWWPSFCNRPPQKRCYWSDPETFFGPLSILSSYLKSVFGYHWKSVLQIVLMYTFVIECSVVLVNGHDPLLDVLKVRLHRSLELPSLAKTLVWIHLQFSNASGQADRTDRFYLHLTIPLLINLIWFD